MSLWNKNAFTINAILVSLTKKQLLLFVLLSVFSTKVFGAGWNTVWQEDFGVVEDSVCRDFADPNMSVPDHKLADVDHLQDGYYGITNSTYWAFIHKKNVNPFEAYHFVPGRDHTGNENGGMLVVNVGTNGTGETIYENYLNLNICGNHKYKLSMYVANVSDAQISPHLTLNVYNIKDPLNPELLKSVELLEDDVVKWPASEKNSTGLYIHKQRPWTESSLEFTAKDGDVLKIIIKNYNSWGGGNDFAIDDILLQRYDDEEIIQPKILSDDNLSKTNCKPTYVVTNTELLDTWKALYSNIYFLWQYSTDEGYTWANLPGESGIEKTSLLRDTPLNNSEVYRLIIAGGNTDAEAQSKAEYISVNGTPENGCDYYSISNIISQTTPKKKYVAYVGIDNDKDITTKPAYDCEVDDHYVSLVDNEWDVNFPSYSFLWQYSNDESTWTDLANTSKDFIFTDDFEGLTYFRAILASDDNVLKQVKENGKPDDCYDDYFITNSVALECSTACKKPEYETTLDKLVICEDSNDPIEWKVTQTNTAKVESKEWYKKENGDTDWTLIGGETGESLSITNPKVSTSYLFLAKYKKCVSDSISFELNVNPAITLAPLSDLDVCEGSNVEFNANVLTGSPTGYIWDNTSSTKVKHSLNNILTEKTITLSATDGVCTSPEVRAEIKVEKKANFTLDAIPVSICEGETIDLVATAQLSSVNTFKWEKNGSVITNSDLSTSDIADIDAIYKFSVLGDKCPTIEKELTIAVEKKADVTLQQIPNAVCEGETIDLVATALLSSANTFKWEKNGSVITNSDLSTSDIADIDATYKFSVLGDKCPAIEKELTIVVEKKADVTLQQIPNAVCEGETINLVATAQLSSANTFKWEKNGSVITNSDLSTSDIADIDATYKFSVFGDECQTIEKELAIAVDKKADVSVQQIPNAVCEGETIDLVATALLSSANTFKWEKNGSVITNSDLSTSDIADIDATYKFSVLGDKCPTIEKELSVTIEKKPELTLAISKTIACENEPVELTVDGVQQTNATCLIKKENDTQYSDFREINGGITAESFNIELDKSASFKVVTKSLQVCQNVESNEVSIVIESPIEVICDSVAPLICEDSEVVLNASINANTSASYGWKKNGDDSFGKNQTRINDTPTGLTSYEFWAESSVCHNSYSKKFEVDVESRIQLDLIASQTAICKGDSVVLSTTYPYIEGIMWKVAIKGPFYNIIGSRSEITVTPFETTKYSVFAFSEHGCPEYVTTIEIFVDQPFELTAEDVTICEGETAHIEVATQNKVDKITWILGDGDSIDSNDNYYDIASDSSLSVNIIAYSGYCKEEITANVNVVPLPHILNHEQVGERSYQMIVDNTDEELYFDYGKGKTTSDILENITYGRNYYVEVSNNQGCATKYQFNIPILELEFPRFFYQGEEYWTIKNLERYQSPVLTIYDRFGRELYVESGSTNGWDGTYNGHNMPSTDYWYQLDVPEIDKMYSGHFTLMRK